MPKRKESGFDLLASMPWPAPVALGIVAYVGVRHGIGWFFGSSQNIYIATLAKQLSSDAFAPFAWLLLGACWLAAVASYIDAKRRRRLLETQTGLDSVHGLLAHHHASEVKIIAVGAYTAEAQRFAAGKPIELITGGVLLDMIRGVQNSLADSTPPAHTSTVSKASPLCPHCGKAMQLRTNRRTHEHFWGCTSYPSCRGTRQIAGGGI